MSARRWLTLMGAALLASAARADVTYDSSSAADAPLHAGNTWLIEESHGVQRGGNLFHGFGRFDLAPGETAFFRPTFPELRDPVLPAIEHVIARVSGGVPSSIQGTITSGYGVDLYLLNPAGVIFGQGAKLDLRGGAFVASTANVLRLGAERVEVPLGTSDPFPLLAVGAPSSFGFLSSASPAEIRIADTRLTNARPFGLFGGSVEVERALVSAPASDLYVAAVHSGDIGIGAGGFDLSGVQGVGSISLLGAVLSTSGIEPSGNVAITGAGDLFIRGGDLLGIDASISANTVGQDPGGDIDVVLDGDLQFERRAIHGAGIFAFSQFPDRVITPGTGRSGNIHVQADDVTLFGGARISTGALGDGAAGGIDIDASGQVRISGRDAGTVEPEPGGLFVATAGGPGGSIAVTARDLLMDDFGVIVGETRSPATGGSIDIDVQRLDISGNARIDSSTRGSGDGGSIHVRASESVHISGSESATEFSGITAFAQAESTGDAGSILVETPSLTLEGGGQISTAGLGAQSDGGNIEVQATDRVELEDSRISTNVNGGTGGNIVIDPDFVILRNGQIVAQAGAGTGGSIDITAGLFVADVKSLVSASSASGIDGTVVIRSPDVDLSDDLAALPDQFVDPANLLADRCAARATRARGSLTLRELDALPDWPGRLRPSRYAVQLARAADRELQEIWGAARAAEQRGDDALALERWDSAAARATTPLLRAAAKLGSAQALEHSGRSGRALARIDEALAELGSGPGMLAAAATALRGRIRSDRAELERALRLTSDPEQLARIHIDLGAAHQRAGEREAALRAYAEAERFAKQAGDLQSAVALRANRATLHLESGDAQRAKAELATARAALAQVPDDHDAAFAALHTILDERVLESDSASAAEPLDRIAQSAATRGDARAGSFARSLLAQVLAQSGQPERAAEAAREALMLAQRARAPEAELVAQRLLGRQLAALGEGGGAVHALERAYALRAGHFAGIADPDTGSAAHTGWFSTSALLDELVDQLLRLAAATEDPAERERLLLAARDHLDDGTALALREYFADECLAAQRVVSVASLPGAVVVYSALLPDRIELIVSSPDGTRSIPVAAKPAEILADARSLAELSQQRTSRRYRAPAARLYDALVRPLEAELGGDGERTLVVVPRGALLRVPWAALWDARRGSHLIEHYALAIVPGLSLAESQPVSGDVRALKAGVSEGVQGLPALPAVTRELGEISSVYTGPTLLDAGFSAAQLETALRAEPYGVLHIASHASFGASADDAYVVTWDGRLGARQLVDLVELTRFRDRPLELLALSACDTSVGDERAALGLAGLAVRSGARSTLGTLWPVDDEATAGLIGRFYRELARPGGSRAGALRHAQLAALADPGFEHPAYWSPFVMIGSWQ